jgi:N-methylhydantoinase B
MKTSRRKARIKFDPIVASVITAKLANITREMGETMLRTSRSPIFSESRDFVTAVFDPRNRLIAQSTYIPVLLGSLPCAMDAVTARYKDACEGDLFLLNDPYVGNTHIPDLTVLKPVFHRGKLIFWVVNKGHHADLGGAGIAGYNPDARTVFDEGLRLPPTRLFSRGKRIDEVWNLLLSNVRNRELVQGDLLCQIGATRIGELALRQLVERYDYREVEHAIALELDATRTQMEKAIALIPDGRYSAERALDFRDPSMPQPRIRLKITVKNKHAAFDYSGTDAEVPGFLNSSYANTVSSSWQALLGALGKDVRMNHGSYEAISVAAPEGTLVNARDPAPTTACTVVTCAAIVEATWLALAEAIPDRIQACWGKWCGPHTEGFNPRTRRRFVSIHHFCKGGGGATEGIDGWNHVGPISSMGGARAPDPERHEMTCPYFLEAYEYLRDSGGPGKWRGGLGVRYRFRVLADNVQFVAAGGGLRPETATFGAAGGRPAPLSILTLERAGGATEHLDVNRRYVLNRGDVVEILANGGGGFGDPLARDPQAVLQDVLDGIVSEESARRDYGVAVEATSRAVDRAETARLRSGAGNNGSAKASTTFYQPEKETTTEEENNAKA